MARYERRRSASCMVLALAEGQLQACGIVALAMQKVLACPGSRASASGLVGTESSLLTVQEHWLVQGCNNPGSCCGRFVLGCSRKRQIGPWAERCIGAPS